MTEHVVGKWVLMVPDGANNPSEVRRVIDLMSREKGVVLKEGWRVREVAQGRHRGHETIETADGWAYADSSELVANNPHRACGHCNKPNRDDGHDACMGELPGVVDACCGHGQAPDAYVKLYNGDRLHGTVAWKLVEAVLNPPAEQPKAPLAPQPAVPRLARPVRDALKKLLGL